MRCTRSDTATHEVTVVEEVMLTAAAEVSESFACDESTLQFRFCYPCAVVEEIQVSFREMPSDA